MLFVVLDCCTLYRYTTNNSIMSIRPVRPIAIATLITNDDCLPGAQTLLYSLKKNLPSINSLGPDDYLPELIVLVTPNISNSVRDTLHPAFCTRLVEVDHIVIPDTIMNAKDENAGVKAANESHVLSRSDNCSFTKLHLFQQMVYSKILYIDNDCLAQKDVSHLFKSYSGFPRGRLLAAAPEIFSPDKFDAGVLLISPSRALYEDLIAKAKSLITNDGGAAGFLNAYFDDWHSYPAASRLGLQYNAQSFMYQCSYEKRHKYLDIAVRDIIIIHYSSSLKPWQRGCESKPLSLDIESKFLTEEEADNIAKIESMSKTLDDIWDKYTKKSVIFQENFEEEEKLKRKQKIIPQKKKAAPVQPSQSQRSSKKKKASIDFNKRYKELRKEGLDAKTAMKEARADFGMDKDDQISAGKQVAQMFGMPM